MADARKSWAGIWVPCGEPPAWPPAPALSGAPAGQVAVSGKQGHPAGYVEVVTDPVPAAEAADICDARRLFPATADRVYFNTAAVGLASRRLADAYHEFVDEWTAAGLDYSRGEQAAGAARSAVARLIGADVSDIALIPSVSSAAGLVAAQFGPARPGESIVIGQREYSSNHFPWRQLATKGYDVRQVPFRNGGLEPERRR